MFNTLCAAESALRSNAVDVERAQKRMIAIEKHTENLLATTNHPAITSNIAEAISEVFQEPNGCLLRHISMAIEANQRGDRGTIEDHALHVGMHIINGACEYWQNASRKEAASDVDNSCVHCFGDGCPQCAFGG